MAPEDILSLTHRRPFAPLRIVSTDGTCYDILHPELTMVSPLSVIVGYPNPKLPRSVLRYDIVSLLHILRIEPLESAVAPAPSQGNGAES
jgi:hypothetical protein